MSSRVATVGAGPSAEGVAASGGAAPTSAVPPDAGHLDAAGRYPRELMRALSKELDVLVADLRPAAGGPAGAVPPPGHLRLEVAVRGPGGTRMHHLGVLPTGRATAAVPRLVAHLPGARIEERRADDGAPEATVVVWGAAEPDWTPTAVAVVEDVHRLWRERDQVWTATEVARRLGIARDTWGAYVRRHDAGAPPPLGTIVEAGTDGIRRRQDVWAAQAVTAWHATRPGHGGHPRRATS
jgi:hypothetical protein